jgi:predicted lipoprotein with Yx(FWY)xxD motif
MRSALLTVLAGTALTLAACGGEKASLAPAPAPAPASAAQAAPSATPGSTVAVKAATSPLGQILVDPTGRTLYAFTNDVGAASTCTGTCAEAWPPVVVDERWNVAPGLDSGVFSTTTRTDGSLQLMAGKFPLYYFSGDAKPGDLNGQASGDVWFVVDPAARIVRDAAGGTAAPGAYGAATTKAAPAATTTTKATSAPVVGLADTELGRVLVDATGRTLYGFTKDVDGTSTCAGGCATAWPPLLVTGDVAVGAGLSRDAFTVIDRADGATQLKVGKWPLYTFSGDDGPGDTNGQGSGGSWFVVAADGKLVKG